MREVNSCRVTFKKKKKSPKINSHFILFFKLQTILNFSWIFFFLVEENGEKKKFYIYIYIYIWGDVGSYV